MRRYLPVLTLFLVWTEFAQGHGLLIPEEKSIPRWPCWNHQVTITMEDQVSVTRVEQTFRNHTTGNSKRPISSLSPKGRVLTNSPCG